MYDMIKRRGKNCTLGEEEAMLKKKDIRVADNLVNLTGKTIYLYDDASGLIEGFLPSRASSSSKNWLTDPVFNTSGHPRTYYVVDGSCLRKLYEAGRPLDDIAIVYNTGLGRGNVIVSYLRLAKDIRTTVRYERPSAIFAF